MTSEDRDAAIAGTLLERQVARTPMILLRARIDEAGNGPPRFVPTYVCRSIRRFTGVSGDHPAKALAELTRRIHPDDLAKLAGLWDQAMADRPFRLSAQLRLTVHDGQERWLQILLSEDEEGTGLVFGHGFDVTERVEALGEALRANRAKNQFLSRMSHELRTPLNAILGFSQLLHMDNLTASQHDHVDRILRASRHLLLLIEEVLDISRIDAGEMTVTVEPVAVAAVIDDVSHLLGPLAESRSIGIVSDVPSDTFVFADRQRFTQILINLVSNAIKYNQPAGKVTITTSPDQADPSLTCLAVTDTGPGVPEHLHARLFDPFDRLGAEQSATEGTGIGLAIARSLAVLMHGDLAVTSEVGQGATFTVKLPTAPSIDGPLTLPTNDHQSTGAADSAKNAGLQSLTVVNIEDNPINQQLITHIVAHRPHWKVQNAATGTEGLDLIAACDPDLVLIDLHLPDMHGANIVESLAATCDSQRPKIAVLTADASKDQQSTLEAIGADHYLVKPIAVTSLLDILDAIAQRDHHPARPTADTVRIGSANR